MSPLPLSVFIIAHNEADRIGNTIRSVREWVDEVIVIDSGSDDGTPGVARELGANVLHNPWPGYGLQKRYGEDQCHNRWVLNLDADEVISPALAKEIQTLFMGGLPPKQGYFLRIAEIMPTETRLSVFAHSLSPVRLYTLDAGRYADSTVHDRVQFAAGAELGRLRGAVLHYSSRGLMHSIEKINRYSDMQAKDRLTRKGKVSYLTVKLLFIFPLAFFKAYILRRYVCKGLPGFINAVVYAFSRFLRLAKMHELWVKQQRGEEK